MNKPPSIARGSWISALVLMALIVRGLWYLHPWAAYSFLAAAVVGVSVALRHAQVRRRRGYWVEYLSPHLLRGDEDEFGVVYHEGGRELWLVGHELPAPRRWPLEFPAQDEWEAQTGDWAAGRRNEILGRVRADTLVARRCELVERRIS